MPVNFAMSAMCVAEFPLCAVLVFLFWKKGLHLRFPAMGFYLAMRLVTSPVFTILLFIQSTPLGRSNTNPYLSYCAFYFYAYWAAYFASSALFFPICIEIVSSALSIFPDLRKSGVMIFRLAALASAVTGLSTIKFTYREFYCIPVAFYRLMRMVSITELCMLVFLCLSMATLRISMRDITFGIVLGFVLLSSSDFILSSFWTTYTSLTDTIQFVSEAAILGALGTWIVYSALPVRARNPMQRAVDTLCR